jgi:hypothetical protein
MVKKKLDIQKLVADLKMKQKILFSMEFSYVPGVEDL